MPHLSTSCTHEPSHTPPPDSQPIRFSLLLTSGIYTLVTTNSSVPCTSALPVGNQHRDMLPIIVWQPNVIFVFDGDILMTSATFGSVGDVTPQGMWSITAQLIPLPNHVLAELITGPIPTTMISTPLWTTTEKVRHVKPGAQVYEGGIVTISFISHVFFLISVTCHPYFHFTPLYEETNLYLLAFPSCSTPFIVPL